MAARHDLTPSPEELERCLSMLAVTGGNTREAAERLAALEPPIKRAAATLGKWRTKHFERYAKIQADHAQLIESVVIQQARDTILQSGALQAAVLEKLAAAVANDDLEPRDLANVLQKLSVTAGINIDKLMLLTNRPTVIAEKRDAVELIKAIQSRVPGLIVGSIDGEAMEIRDQPLIGGTDDGGPDRDSDATPG